MKKAIPNRGRRSRAQNARLKAKTVRGAIGMALYPDGSGDFVNRFKKAQTLLDQGCAEKAYEATKELLVNIDVRDGTRYPAVMRLAGIAAFQAGRLDDASSYAEAGLACCDDSLDFNYIAAVAAASRKEYRDAIRYSEKFLELYAAKTASRERGLWDDTIEYRHQVLNAYAVALTELTEYERAEKLLQEAMALRPDYDSSYINLALLYDHRGRHDEALSIIYSGQSRITDSTELNSFAVKLANRATISICLMVKNEEEFLPRCLNSIRDLADEIILVDTGSRDRTLEIAEEFGCVIHHYPWSGDFSAARNETLKHATKDWIFIIDADEELPAGEGPKIRNCINQSDADLLSISVYNKSLDTGTISSFLPSVRLFRRSQGLRYYGIVHNRLNIPTNLRGVRCDVRLYHYGYDLSRDKLAVKQSRTKALLDTQLMEQPDDIYANFNMAQLLRGLKEANGPQISSQIIEHAGRVVRHKQSHEQGYRGQRLMALHQLASAHFNLKQYGEAEKYCREALQAKPDYIDPLMTLGHIYLATSRLSEAARYYQRYLEALAAYEPEEETENIILLFLAERHIACHGLAVIAEKEGRIDDAIRYYRLTLESREPYLDTYCRLGKLSLDKRDFHNARLLFTMETQRDKNSPLAWLGLGEAMTMEGKTGDALAHFQKAAELAPHNPDVIFRLGKTLIALDRISEGSDILSRAVCLAPHVPEMPFECGNVAFETGNYENAAGFYQQALEDRPDYAEARNNLGNCYFQLKQYDDACAQYEQLLRQAPEYLLGRRNLGLACARAGLMEKAADALASYCQAVPGDTDIPRLLGDLYLALGRFSNAIETYEKHLRFQPNDYISLFHVAEAYLALGFAESAVMGYKSVLAIAPDYKPALDRLQTILAEAPI